MGLRTPHAALSWTCSGNTAGTGHDRVRAGAIWRMLSLSAPPVIYRRRSRRVVLCSSFLAVNSLSYRHDQDCWRWWWVKCMRVVR
jgi:hypothetical protein